MTVDRRGRRALTLTALTVFGAAAVLHTAVAGAFFHPRWTDAWDILPSFGPLFLSEWAGHLPRILGAVLFAFSLPGLGGLALRSRGSGGFETVLRAGAGLALWGTGGILLAAAGATQPVILRVLSLVLIGIGLWKGAEHRPRFSKPADPLFFLPVLFIGFYVLTTLVPETFYDALVYHLAVPSEYLKAGRWVDQPDIHLTRLPGMIQSIYLWGLAWGDDRFCKLQNLAIGMFSAAALGFWTRDRFGRSAGTWAAALFLSLPLVGINLWSCANDLLAGLFLFLAFDRWQNAWEKDSATRRPMAAVAWSGIFLGAAAASKMTVLFAAPFFLWDGARKGVFRRPQIRNMAVFAAFAALPLLPWWIRNGLWTGNPFYPLASSLLGGDSPENIALLTTWKADARGASTLVVRALAFIKASLRGAHEGRFGFLGPTLLMALPWAALRLDCGRLKAVAEAAGLSYILFAVMSGHLRYFLPGLFFVVVLTGAAVGEGGVLPRWGRIVMGAAVLLNGLWMALAFQRFNQGWAVVWGRISPKAYLREEHIGVYNQPTQGAYDFLLRSGARGRVFLLGEARAFRCPLPVRASGNFNKPGFARWIDENPSPEGFVERLKREGYTRVVLNAPELLRITPSAYLTEEKIRVLEEALRRLGAPLYRDRWSVVFAVTP